MSNFVFGRGRLLYSTNKKPKIDNDELLLDIGLTCENSPNLSPIEIDLHTDTNNNDFDFHSDLDLIDDDELLSSETNFIPLIPTPNLAIDIESEINIFNKYLNGAKLLQGDISSVSYLNVY